MDPRNEWPLGTDFFQLGKRIKDSFILGITSAFFVSELYSLPVAFCRRTAGLYVGFTKYK